MKILSIGNFGFGWDGSICDEEHIAGALEKLGHVVYRQPREELNMTSYKSSVHWFKPDFTLIAQWDGYPEDLSLLPKPLVYWAFDYQADGQAWHERLVKQADLYLSKRLADSKYPNWRWLSQDFAPEFLEQPEPRTPYDRVEKTIDVLFTGSYLPWATERNETLKAVDEKFNLVIHSVNEWPGFKDVRGPVMDAGLSDLYAKAKVVLSIDHTLEAGYWSDRNAQIMCCGARPLFRYVPLSEATFHNYVDYFNNEDECLGEIESMLKALPAAVELINHDTYKYAQTNLKVRNRVQDLLTIVGSIL